MSRSLELRCENCGSADVGHVTRGFGSSEQWRNCCGECGRESDYTPTLEEIRYHCARFRSEQAAAEVDDDLEKFWRQRAAELITQGDDKDDEPLLANATEIYHQHYLATGI